MGEAAPALILPDLVNSAEAFAPSPRHFVIGRDGLVKYASYEADLSGAIEVIAAELAAL